MSVLNQTDAYKLGHPSMFPDGTLVMVNNFTPRKSRIEGVTSIVHFGLQYFIKEYLYSWQTDFFDKPIEEVIRKYKKRVEGILGKGAITYNHIRKLHEVGHLPIKIMGLPEGSNVNIKVAPFIVFNTHPAGYWLPGYLETILSCTIWQPSTSATHAREFRKEFNRAAIETTGSADAVQFQGHDFSMRGMSSLETACTSGAGHLVFFDGTDTVPAIDFLEDYYGLDTDTAPLGFSVPATEHSVMCMGGKETEVATFNRLLNIFPKGILSVVSDTWDLWTVLTKYLPDLKDVIMHREGKLVIRPDSGDPVDIICGIPENVIRVNGKQINSSPATKGVIELLWDVFGGTVNELGYKMLDSHIGAIYGDSISLQRAKDINKRLKDKGFASTNWVAGIGSYTYQYNTRDTFGWAMKATYGEVITYTQEEDENGKYAPIGDIEKREIWKDPITDDGTKKSAKGLLAVYKGDDGKYFMKDQATWKEVYNCAYEVIYADGKLIKDQTIYDVRKIANNSL